MSRVRRYPREIAGSDLASALEVLDATDLRELIREAILEMDEEAGAVMADRIVARSARRATGWTPQGPDEAAVAEALRDPSEPQLEKPERVKILETADVEGPIDSEARSLMLTSLRQASEKRFACVTKEQRRRHYEHAARLVATYAALDPTPEGNRWLAELRSRYRRYPALQYELRQLLGRAP